MFLKDHLTCQLPVYSEYRMNHLLEGTSLRFESAILAQTQFFIEKRTMGGKILHLLEIDPVRQIIRRVNEILAGDASQSAEIHQLHPGYQNISAGFTNCPVISLRRYCFPLMGSTHSEYSIPDGWNLPPSCSRSSWE